MNHRTSRRAAALAALAWAGGAAAQAGPPAPSPAPAPAPQQVEVTGGRESDTEQRRQSTAAKIVIGREEIDKFGDSTLGEVLRRLPGVTTPGAPGRGGPPRLRGLGNGYTQILLDGQRIPPGFSLESISPEQIERIEILRAPTAETGARAIAGTINIITREGYRRRINDLRLGFAVENGKVTPGASWTRNDSIDNLTYNLSASAFNNHRLSSGSTETTDVDTATGTPLSDWIEDATTREKRLGLNATGRLQWRLGEGEMLSLAPNFFHAESRGDRAFSVVQPVGDAAPYDSGSSVTRSTFTTARLNGQWRNRWEGGLRSELNGGLGGWRSRTDLHRDEFTQGTPDPRVFTDLATTRERSASMTLKLAQALGGGGGAPGVEHSAVGGVEAEAVRRTEVHTTTDSATGGDTLADSFGDNLQASSLRLAAYAQDEWNPTPNWSFHAGLRWEGITTTGDGENGERPTNRSSVATPLLHAVWKPDPKARDQVRMSLTRSYRSPSLGALIARPAINPRYSTDVSNTPTTADRAGNPDLKPELATGIDVAFERYLSGGGLLSANVFHRRISNLMRSVTAPETVSWSPAVRYVARQQNIGGATTEGVELEAKFGLDQAIEGAPRVETRANLAFFRSKVDSVPGPDNRLDQQAHATANLGGDYRFRGLPLTLGGNLNWVPGYETQLEDNQRTGVSTKRVFDLYALWTFNPALALRLLASNLAPRDYETRNTITFTEAAIDKAETARSTGPSYTNWQLRLEIKL
ncbi:MAG: TonB-dependent receptor [Rubrivivax sp.]